MAISARGKIFFSFLRCGLGHLWPPPGYASELEYLRSLNFSWTHIAELLGVSRVTIHRRRRELDMVDNNGIERSISDTELQSLLQQIRQEMPNIGETLVIGHLRSLGFTVTRQRVHNAIHTTDPLNTLFRWTGILTPRRPYSVPSPNSLWHIGMSLKNRISLNFLHFNVWIYCIMTSILITYCRYQL